MTNNLKAFLDYLHEQVMNHSIYVWGAQGQQGATITEAWIQRWGQWQYFTQRIWISFVLTFPKKRDGLFGSQFLITAN